MMNSRNPIIEVTENNYAIKFSKNVYALSYIKQLLKLVQATDSPLLADNENQLEADDLRSRNESPFDENFDRLADK